MNSSADHYDAIIIGAGVGGLVCGALLAKHGLKTVILERCAKPGGYAMSYQRGGFTFDVAHVMPGIKGNSPIAGIFSYLGVDRDLELVELERTFRFIFPDVRVDCWTDIHRYEAELCEAFPHERTGLRRYFESMQRIWYSPPHMLQDVHPLTFHQFLDRFIADRRLKEVLGSAHGFIGLNGPRVGAVNMVRLLMAYHVEGAVYPRGGCQSLPDALARIAQRHGAELRLNAAATRILVNGNRACGVLLANGERLSAGCVISNADTKRTFLNLIGVEHLPAAFVAAIHRVPASTTGLAVHLGVNMPISDQWACGCTLYHPSYDAIENAFQLAAQNRLPTDFRQSGFGLTVPSLWDPTVASPGGHSVYLTRWPVPYARYPVRMRESARDEYVRLKNEDAEFVIRAAEQLLPGLASHVVVQDVATPLSFERWNGATEGCWYDFAQTPGWMSNLTLTTVPPIQDFYMTGVKLTAGCGGIRGAVLGGAYTADRLLCGTLAQKGLLRCA